VQGLRRRVVAACRVQHPPVASRPGSRRPGLPPGGPVSHPRRGARLEELRGGLPRHRPAHRRVEGGGESRASPLHGLRRRCAARARRHERGHGRARQPAQWQRPTEADFARDAEAKSYIAGVEDQKAAYIKQCKAYWETRDKLDTLLADVKTTVADAGATLAEKKKQIFPSGSVAAIQDFKDDLETWYKDVSSGLQKLLRSMSLPKDKRLAWAAPVSTSKAKITDLQAKQSLHDMAELLRFIEARAQTDKTRANTHKAIRDRLARVAADNPGA
jgi:hypothetical protein